VVTVGVGRALVLAGGGVAGVAWELGVIVGLRDAGVDVRDADVVIGTSAGSVVGAQILSGADLDALYAAQSQPSAERPADLGPLMMLLGRELRGLTDPTEIRIRMGALALRAETISEEERLRVVAARLPSPDWPERRLIITAVDALTGELVTFSEDSGVALVDAVAASCAVPGIWPPTTIGGRRYIDGGVRSPSNADLAEGYQALVITPFRTDEPMAGSVVIGPDDASAAAIGPNPLDPERRAASAEAGRAVGVASAVDVRARWGDVRG
jgi:NTE family protein